MSQAGNTVNAKGQIVIPVELRRKFGIKKGTQLAVFEENGGIVVMPMTDLIRSMRGFLKGGKYTYRDFVRERREDRF